MSGTDKSVIKTLSIHLSSAPFASILKNCISSVSDSGAGLLSSPDFVTAVYVHWNRPICDNLVFVDVSSNKESSHSVICSTLALFVGAGIPNFPALKKPSMSIVTKWAGLTLSVTIILSSDTTNWTSDSAVYTTPESVNKVFNVVSAPPTAY